MKTIHLHTLGFPRIGARRELKTALESFWRGDSSEAELRETGRVLRRRHWALQADSGLDFVTVGDFAWYDQVASHIGLFGCEPARFKFGGGESALTRCFAMARGGHAGRALDMARWFDTNYHYLVPEFDAGTAFSLHADALLAEVAEARALGYAVKVALIAPLTFLWLGKARDSERSDLLDALIPHYCSLLRQLKDSGAAWIQLDEPILGLDLPPAWRNAVEPCYWHLAQAGAKLMLATYFSPLEENLSLACRLPVAGLHVDGVRARQELVSVCDWLPLPKVLSVGIVDGRNVWRTDLDAAICVLAPLLARRQGQLWLAPSCSLLHLPFSLEGETGLDPEIRSWMAFASEKLDELSALRAALSGDDSVLAASRAVIASRARNDMGECFAARLDGFAFTRHGWVQSHGARCVKPPVIFGDVSRPRAMTAGWSAHRQLLSRRAVKGRLTGPVTILQQSFVRDDQPRSSTCLQIALAMRAEVADLRQAGVNSIQIDEPALREGLPLRRARRDDYLAWATHALRVAGEAPQIPTPVCHAEFKDIAPPIAARA